MKELESSVKKYIGMFFQLSTFNFIQSFRHIIYNILDSVHPCIEEDNRDGGRSTNLKTGKENLPVVLFLHSKEIFFYLFF